jgi:hypothetical protein
VSVGGESRGQRRESRAAEETSGGWRVKEPALTWVKFDLNKNYE